MPDPVAGIVGLLLIGYLVTTIPYPEGKREQIYIILPVAEYS
ncbi:hypothetical protein SAMN04489760_10494 [Syntrophus gentianae]|uniref:Uncharacterized protein n=1 Tax=Syntrophus gentianae TaxID=43775 RepID=A0A1H7VPY3_9BACT|nr:hypothetical protein [Syntrophus gentianae]SEM10875.1 hypothetical protein SAMN04489760_10494 [Syntrophus gentianae]